MLLDTSEATEKVGAPLMVYIPRCMVPLLLVGMHLSCIAWSILQDLDKKFHISEACAPLLVWLRVMLLPWIKCAT